MLQFLMGTSITISHTVQNGAGATLGCCLFQTFYSGVDTWDWKALSTWINDEPFRRIWFATLSVRLVWQLKAKPLGGKQRGKRSQEKQNVPQRAGHIQTERERACVMQMGDEQALPWWRNLRTERAAPLIECPQGKALIFTSLSGL